jgi:hypothetical protein
MITRQKPRVGSHRLPLSQPKPPKVKEEAVYGVPKVPSLHSDYPSPMRLTDKYRASPYKQSLRGFRQGEVAAGGGEKPALVEEAKWLMLQKKMSERKLRDVPQVHIRSEKGAQNLLKGRLDSQEVLPGGKM